MAAPIALAATIAVIVPLRSFADQLGLVDVPTSRKQHAGAVPVVGGIAMLFGVSVAVIASGHLSSAFWLGVSAYFSLLCGMVDDKFSIRAALRLLVQCMVALILLLGTSVKLSYLGEFLPGVGVHLDSLSLPFTVFCIVGVINAVNMIDGMDGLSGSLMLVTFSALAAISLGTGGGLHVVSLAVSCALLGFLLFNARLFGNRARVFMGDAGSTTIGLIAAFLLISQSQGERSLISPIGAAWILGVPLIDAMTVIIKRSVSGRSVFVADRTHVHHVLLDVGYSVNATVIRLAALQAILVSVGCLISMNRPYEALGFWGFVALVGLSYAVSNLVARRIKGEAVAPKRSEQC